MSDGTLIVLKKNGSDGSRFNIEQDNVYNIGSSFDCHLRFNLAKDFIENVCTISTKKKGTVTIKKMSSFPVLVNNKQLSSPKNLKTGDVIKIGSKRFRWDSEMTKSENTTASSQKKISSSGSLRIPVAPIRSRRRSSIMKIRKIMKAENLRPWQETSECIVSSKAEPDNPKFTVSVSPVKVSSAADCSIQGDKQHKLRSSRGATNTPKTTTDMRTPKVTGKARTTSKIPVACTETTQSNEIVKTPVIACSPLKTPNIKAIKSAIKKSASIKKSSDCIMQAKKWKISDITDDTTKSPELFDIVNAENEHDANVSSDTLSIFNASFSKQEETPKLRNASTKKFITNKSHTELKKVIKKLRRGSLPAETEVDSPVINKLISAKTVATDDLSALSQSDLSTRRSLQKKITQIDLPNISSDVPAIRRSMRKQNSLSPPSEANQSDLMKDDQLNTSQHRRSLRMENRLTSVQLNSSFNKSEHTSNSQSIIAQSDSPLRKSSHKEQRISSVKKSENKVTGSQSDFENSPQSLPQNNLNNSSVKKHGEEDQLNSSQSEVLVARKSLRKEMQLHDISQADLSVTESVQNVNLLDISQPELSRSTSNDNVSTRKLRRKTNLLDITENNPRISMRKSSNIFNISQNISGVGFLNDDNDLIDWNSPDIEQNNVIEPESRDYSANENEDLMDFEDENNEVAKDKKATGRKVQNSPLNDLSDIRGVKALMKTPGRGPKTPKNDLTDVRGVKQLLDPKKSKSPKNDLTNVAGVKALLETPGRKGKTPKNDLTNVHGVKRLMNPFREPQSPENDLTKEVWGFKQLLSTPKIQKSPLNDLSDVKGLRNLLKTPGREVKSPENDLSDVRGIKRLMNPFKDPKSPENDLTEVPGVKSLFRTPKIQNSPNNDLTSVKGVKSLLKTPGRKQNSPENDLRDVRGVKQLLDPPKLVKSPENDLSDIRGVKQLFKRNNMPRNDLTDVEDVRHLFVTPEKPLNQSVEEEINTMRVSSMDDIFNELKYENEPADSPLSHLRKSPLKTYERKAMSLSPMKRDADNVKFKTRYSERVIQGPAAHVQKWIEEQTVLSSNRDDANEIDKRILPVVEPEVSETQSKLINQGVLRTKNLDDVENTSDTDMTPRTRTRRQRIKAVEDTKTTSPLNHGKTEPLNVEGITEIVPEQNISLKRRGRPKGTAKNVTDIETVTSTRSRRGRGKDAAEDEVVEEVVFIQKTTRRLRNNEKTGVETVEVIQNNMIEDVNILHSLGITENEKKKNSRKRTKAETGLDTDTVENKSSKRQRKEDTSLHVKFDLPDIDTPTEPKRTRRGTKKTETDENETKPTVRRGRNTRRKESDENQNDSEIIEIATPQITEVQIDTKLPAKRGRNTRKKEQDESEEKVEENEAQATQKRGRNTRKKQVTEIEIIVVSDENVEENTVKPRRKQPAKKIVVETDENDINAINVPARRTRAAKVIKEIEKTEDSEEESTGKKVQRKRRSPYTVENAEEKIDSSTKTKRRKANEKVAEQEDANSSTKTTKRTRVNVIKEQEEPVRKSTRTRKVKC